VTMLNIFIGVLGTSYSEAYAHKDRTFMKARASMICDYTAMQRAYSHTLPFMKARASMICDYLHCCRRRESSAKFAPDTMKRCGGRCPENAQEKIAVDGAAEAGKEEDDMDEYLWYCCPSPKEDGAINDDGSSDQERFKKLEAAVQQVSLQVKTPKQCLPERDEASVQERIELQERQELQERGDLERRLVGASAKNDFLEIRAVAAETALLKERAENERLKASLEHKDEVDDLSQQLLVLADERDVARVHAQELFDALSAKEDELAEARRAAGTLTQKLQTTNIGQDRIFSI